MREIRVWEFETEDYDLINKYKLTKYSMEQSKYTDDLFDILKKAIRWDALGCAQKSN